MCVPTLKISLPFPFSMIDSVPVHVSPMMTIKDVIKVVLQNSKDAEQILTSDYGLYLPTRLAWFLPSSLVQDYMESLCSLMTDEQIQLIPKRLYYVTFSCYKYSTRIQCGADQKIEAVIRRVIKIFSRENPKFSGPNATSSSTTEDII